jgi:hypothetical protein
MKLPEGLHHWFYVPIVCVASYYFVQAQRDTSTLIQHVDRTAALSNDTLAMVNVALKGTHKNGDDGLLFRANLLVANADSAVNALKQTAQQLDKASRVNEPKAGVVVDESITLIDSGKQAVTKLGVALDTLNSVIALARDGTLPKLNAGIDSLNEVVSGLAPAERSANDLLVSGNAVMVALKGTVMDADKLIADPNLTLVAKNLSDGTKSGASAMAHVDKSMSYVEVDLSPKHMPLWQTLLEGAIGNVIGIPFKRISQSVSVVNTVTTK